MAMPPVPVTVLTGFLGSGKTTLLNALLSNAQGWRYAVIVNEFGEIGIDNELIVGASEDVLEMSNGCICCTMRGDLLRSIYELLTNRERFDAIIIETTGLAEPLPILQTFLTDVYLREKTAIDGVICVVDACHGDTTLADNETAREQVALADHLLISKTDVAEADSVTKLRATLARLNPLAPVGITIRGDTGCDAIIGKGAFDLARLDIAAAPDESCDAPGHVHDDDCGHHHHHSHLDGIDTISLAIDEPLDGQAVTDWLDELVVMRAADLLRAKGILSVAGEDERLVFHAVHNHLEGEFQRQWRQDEQRNSRLVFIGRKLDRDTLRRGLEACVAPE